MRERLGPYRLVEVLGRGGMGVVYRAVHERLERLVAIKAVAAELTQQPHFRDRFFAEARTHAQLQHPNIITIHDLLEEDGEYFIVMEYFPGRSLDQVLEESGAQGLGERASLEIFRQVLAALGSAHRAGVVHRDVKPSNVLLDDDQQVKLMDFGIALLVGDKRLTQSSQTIGTPVYMSPEQILRPRELDHRTDIYSAAVLLYEMLSGRPPFDAETEYEIKKQHIEVDPRHAVESLHGTSRPVVETIVRALAKDPGERFESTDEFLAALGLPAATAPLGTHAPDPPPSDPPSLAPARAAVLPGPSPTQPSPLAARRPGGGHRGLVAAVAAAGAALLTVIIWAVVGLREEPPPEPGETSAAGTEVSPVDEFRPPTPIVQASRPPTAEPQPPLRVSLSFTQDCWVELVIDGQRRISELHGSGELLQIDAERSVLLANIGNPAGVQVQVNGQPFPLPLDGRLVRDVRIQLPPQVDGSAAEAGPESVPPTPKANAPTPPAVLRQPTATPGADAETRPRLVAETQATTEASARQSTQRLLAEEEPPADPVQPPAELVPRVDEGVALDRNQTVSTRVSQTCPPIPPPPPARPSRTVPRGTRRRDIGRAVAIETLGGYHPSQGYVLKVDSIGVYPPRTSPGCTVELRVRYIVLGPHAKEDIVIQSYTGLKDGDQYIMGIDEGTFVVPRGGGVVNATSTLTIPRDALIGTYMLEALFEDSRARFQVTGRTRFDVR